MKESRIYFAKTQGRGPEEISWCVQWANKWWNDDVAHIFRIADEVIKHEFLFDLAWDMERTWEPVVFGNEIDWEYMPKDDPEFIYQMNRNRYWICLGQAYAMSGEEKYAMEFVAQLISWIEKNPLTEERKQTTWRTIEAGIRGEYWIKAMGYFVNSAAVTDDVWERFQAALYCHGDYLLACDVPFSVKSNWGVLENHGLYMIGMAFPSHTKSSSYVKTAVERLTEQARVQILDDGVHWEQSPMYHNEVLKCYLEVFRTANMYGGELPKYLYERVKKLAYANLIWKKPNHCQPATGDSDETDVRDVLTNCALLFLDGALKSGGYDRLDYEGIWDFGSCGQHLYETIEAKPLKDTLYTLSHEVRPPERACVTGYPVGYALKESGNWYLKSGWQENDDYLHFRCGSLGGGHGHFDKLHIDLALNGEDILVDGGRYTYVPSEERYELKSSGAHNTALIDGKEYANCLDAWGVTGMTLPIAQGGCQKDRFTYLHGGHLGYMKDGIFINRKIVAVGTDIFVIMDEFFGMGNHTYSQRYHFNTEGSVSCDRQTISYKSQKAKVVFHVLNSLSEDTEIKISDCKISRHYNQIEPAKMAEVSCTGDAMASIITVIAKETGDSGWKVSRVSVSVPVTGRILEHREAEAVRIENGRESYLVLLSHVESGTDCEYLSACGVSAIGQVMVCDLAEERPEMTVLGW